MSDLEVLKRNAGLNEGSESMKIKVVNSGYGSDLGYKEAHIIGHELDHRMAPILKVRIKDINLGDPVTAEWRGNEWVVDMD
jgi:hypothetical protein